MARRWRFASRLGGLGIAVAIMAVAGAKGFAQHASAPAVSSPEPAVPVLTTTAARSNVPVYLDGIGTVEADNAVLVRSRVDGTLMQVPVREGQEVKQGDVIAVIDPRPYQAALDLHAQGVEVAVIADVRSSAGGVLPEAARRAGIETLRCATVLSTSSYSARALGEGVALRSM